MLRLLAVVLLLVLALAPAAAASVGVADVRDADGALLAHAGSAPFAYPEDGSWLSIGGGGVLPSGGVELLDVALLGGRVQASRIVVPPRGFGGASVEGLYVDGHEAPTAPNALVPLGPAGYLVVLQQAVAGADEGLVGLRLSISQETNGLAAGTQFLIGVPGRDDEARSADPAWSVLGFERAPDPLLVVPSEAPDPLALPATLGQRAADLALNYLGVPYRWGGADPNGGFDCSGFTMYVYGRLGIDLPHYTGTQQFAGVPVPRDELQPGDLVFFDLRGGVPGHEGIYLGDGRFVHAPSSGDVVKISSFDASYGISFVGAVRPY